MQASNVPPSEVSLLFSKWKAKYGVVYDSPASHNFRLGVFFQNYKDIQRYRIENTEGQYTLNMFADQTDAELDQY